VVITGRKKMASALIVELNSDNFDGVIASEAPVIVDFWAEWCGPCRMIAPHLDEISTEFEGKAVVGKVNVDDNQELAARFGITSIPNIKIFKKGVEVENIVGATPKATLIAALERNL
jgi:thioredoxin 1